MLLWLDLLEAHVWSIHYSFIHNYLTFWQICGLFVWIRTIAVLWFCTICLLITPQWWLCLRMGLGWTLFFFIRILHFRMIHIIRIHMKLPPHKVVTFPVTLGSSIGLSRCWGGIKTPCFPREKERCAAVNPAGKDRIKLIMHVFMANIYPAHTHSLTQYSVICSLY